VQRVEQRQPGAPPQRVVGALHPLARDRAPLLELLRHRQVREPAGLGVGHQLAQRGHQRRRVDHAVRAAHPEQLAQLVAHRVRLGQAQQLRLRLGEQRREQLHRHAVLRQPPARGGRRREQRARVPLPRARRVERSLQLLECRQLQRQRLARLQQLEHHLGTVLGARGQQLGGARVPLEALLLQSLQPLAQHLLDLHVARLGQQRIEHLERRLSVERRGRRLEPPLSLRQPVLQGRLQLVELGLRTADLHRLARGHAAAARRSVLSARHRARATRALHAEQPSGLQADRARRAGLAAAVA